MAALSSDEDELGFHDMTTTPFRVEKFTDATLKATKPNGRAAVAGPSSSKPASARRAPWKRSPSPVDGDEETEHANVSDEGGTEVMEVPAPAPKRGRPKRGASREPEAVQPPKPKAAPRGKGKGKAKQEAARGASPEVMDIDDLEAIREHVEDEPQEVPRHNVLPRNPRNERASAGDVAIWKRREERFLKKIERSEKQAQDAKAQRDALAAQLEEVFHTRNTEAEDLFEQQKSLYESRIQTQEEMIQEQTSQLARVDSLTREGKTSTLHFLTREAADEERRGIERQAEKLKETIKEKEKVIAERESTINDQEVEIRTLKIELAAEVERSKFLASSTRPNGRDPPKAARARWLHQRQT
ncbi:hypothetical protein DFH11DRAFT_1724238 [Phellopilus nigrolimitatus]|nr:hypothetical protein DFH11DRAFT_1724238 [Phellopilus nigrolimitatus]